jgi:hypothetical protein
MKNKEHCNSTKILLDMKPHKLLHSFMDAYSVTMGWGHRTKRHDYKMIEVMRILFGEDAIFEVGLHIACDLNVVTIYDVKIWQGLIDIGLIGKTELGI